MSTSMKLDQTTPAAQRDFARLTSLVEVPAFVKAARMDEVMQAAPRPAHVYADPLNGQFPCDSRAATWLSCLYFLDKAAEYPAEERTKIASRIDHHMAWWGLESERRKLVTAFAAQTKAAAAPADDDFAFVYVHADGRVERHMPMTTPALVKEAADYLWKYRDRFPFQDRNTVAKRILDKAAACGASVGLHREFLERSAGRAAGSPAAVEAMLRDRAKLASDLGVRAAITSMADTVRDRPKDVFTPEGLVELVKTVEAVDRGLNLKYGEQLLPPEDVIFAATVSKVAEAVAQVVPTLTGKIYEKAAFAQIPLDAVRDLFGHEFADEVKVGFNRVDPAKMAALLPTLPLPDLERFEALAASCGIAPAAVKAAGVRVGFDKQDWAQLAESYQPAV